MDLKIKDVVELLSVSEATIRRWIKERLIPAYKLNHQYRFDREEIEHWMLSCKLDKKKEELLTIEEEEEEETKERKDFRSFGLYRAIHRGEVLRHLDVTTKEEAISQTMENVAHLFELDPLITTELLLDREKLMPTALNNKVAVPHAREALFKGKSDVIVVVFPKTPIPWGALDDQPVKVLFFLFACSDKHHLHLLAKLAHLSSDREALLFLESRPSKETLLQYMNQWEAHLKT